MPFWKNEATKIYLGKTQSEELFLYKPSYLLFVSLSNIVGSQPNGCTYTLSLTKNNYITNHPKTQFSY